MLEAYKAQMDAAYAAMVAAPTEANWIATRDAIKDFLNVANGRPAIRPLSPAPSGGGIGDGPPSAQ